MVPIKVVRDCALGINDGFTRGIEHKAVEALRVHQKSPRISGKQNEDDRELENKKKL
jgi:hypothetical protein